MNEQGLGESMAGSNQGGAGQQADIAQVIKMLQNGSTPQELVAAGISNALIEQAMQILQREQRMQQQQQQMQQQQPQGLAGMMTSQQ